jgi:hypothetical protein
MIGERLLDMRTYIDRGCDRTFYKEEQKPFTLVSAMLRLGKKYEFDQLRDDAVARLERSFPSNLADFQNREGRAQIIDYPGFVYDAVNLARETELLSILPAALYCASALPTSLAEIHKNIIYGLPGADGKRVYLSTADKALCILATSTLLAKQWSGSYRWLINAKVEFPHPRCAVGCDTIRDNVLGESMLFAIGFFPLKEGILCAQCTTIALNKLRDGEAKLWDLLPTLFDLPSWEDLRKQTCELVL